MWREISTLGVLTTFKYQHVASYEAVCMLHISHIGVLRPLGRVRLLPLCGVFFSV